MPRMRELALIEAIGAALERRDGSRVVRWIGDDAAVVRGDAYAVTSVDVMVDGTHFRLGQASPADIGHRALAAALSDLAAMGVAPGEAYLGVVLPPHLTDGQVLALHEGAEALAAATGTTIAGGDIVAGPVLTLAVTVVGWAGAGHPARRPRRRALRRPRRRHRLARRRRGRASPSSRAAAPGEHGLIERYLRPLPRLAEGRALARRRRDGDARPLRRDRLGRAPLADASGVRLQLDAGALPLADGVAAVARALGRARARSSRPQAARTSSSSPACRPGGPRRPRRSGLTWVGEVAAGPAELTWRGAPSGARDWHGFEH